METTNLRMGQLDHKVDGLSEKLAEMDAATATHFAETRELIQDRFTILQQRLEKVDGDIRTDMHEGFRRVRAEMKDGFGSIRSEMQDGLGAVRAEMKDGLGAARAEMKDGFGRVDARFEGIDARFDRLEGKLNRVLATRPTRTRGRRRR